MPIPTDTIDKLEQTWRSISIVCADLTEQEWRMHTDLPGWSVQDNLSHLVGTERMLQGLAPAAHTVTPADHVKNAMGEFNEREVDVRRSRPGADVLAEWNDIVEQRVATLRGADEAYYGAPAMTPTGPGTVADFLHIRVMDCWAHEQDIRRALGRPGALDTASAAHSVDRFVTALPIIVGKRAGAPEGQAVRIELTGPAARSLVYEVRSGRAVLTDSPAAKPVVSVTMDAETFAILALGRRQAHQVDGIEITGDRELGERIVANLAIMI